MDDPVVTLFFVTLGAFSGFWTLSAFVADHLQRQHPGTYVTLGGEKTFDFRGEEKLTLSVPQRRYLKFLFGRAHRSLGDRYLSILSDVALALFAITLFLFVVLLRSFLAQAAR